MRILFFVSEDWYFRSHRLSLAAAAVQRGHDVVLATTVNGDVADIEEAGISVIPVDWRRGSMAPWHLTSTVRQLRRTIEHVDPDVVHQVSIVQVLLGGLAATGRMRRPTLSAITGIGSLYGGEGRRARVMSSVFTFVLAHVLRRADGLVMVQNADDAAFANEKLRIPLDRTVLVGGAGVDLERFPLQARSPESPRRVAMVARMLESKGVRDLVDASSLLDRWDVEHEVVLVGPVDSSSSEGLNETELLAMTQSTSVTWLGSSADVASVWARAAVAVLPQRHREGLPLALVEAAASGRPIVTTDVPGCRDIVADGENGILVPPRDPEALAAAIARLLADPDLAAQMGTAGRQMAEDRFSGDAVHAATGAAYERLTCLAWETTC